MSQMQIPASDDELLRRVEQYPKGLTKLLENTDQPIDERLYAISTLFAYEQRGYRDHEQIRNIIRNFELVFESTEIELDKIVHTAIDDLHQRRAWQHQVIRTAPREWDNKLWARRKKLENDVVARHLSTGGIRILPDQPGVGKSTSVANGLLDSGTPHFFACERHEKAVEHKNKEVFADKGEYFHRKGRSQPVNDCCIENEGCNHDPDNPLMCPVYERNHDDPILREFKRQESICTHKWAHSSISEVSDNCAWLDHCQELADKDPAYIVGVHQHLTEFSGKDVVVIDETLKPTTFQQIWETSDIGRASTLLEELQGGGWIARWVDRLRDFIEDADRNQVSVELQPPEQSVSAEELAELKVEFNELLLSEKGFFEVSDRTEPCFDAILGALVQVGFQPRDCRAVVDGPNTLKFCPRCSARTEEESCVNKKCRWNRQRDGILNPREASHPRVCVYMDGDELVYTEIPDADDLPDSVIITDATPSPKLVAAIFGVPEEKIWHEVGPDFDLNAQIIEVGGGQYHESTIRGSDTLRKRIQRAIVKAHRENEKVLYVLKSSLKGYFGFPGDEHIIRHYGAVRGIDITEVDAVMMIGAQHPHIEQVRHIAEALSLDRSDIEIGGEEIKETRTVQVDSESRDRETKAYTGLVGEFFKGSREDEFLQDAHRPRPILAEERITIYKISNVPTQLPIDERLTWSEFLNEGFSFKSMHDFVRPLCDEFEQEVVELTTPELKQRVSDDVSDRSVEVWTQKLVKRSLAEEVLNVGDLRKGKYRIDLEKLRNLG